jgi:NADPH:quinone reductase-like Zn-dependent oxidoreductase
MKAVLLQGYGDVDKLQYGEAPNPHAGPGQVVVRLISTSVNPIDYKIREGAMKERMNLEFPVIIGRDLAGEVTETGEGVTKFQRGDLVMGLVDHSYAEYVAAKAGDLTRIPEGLDPLDAGVLPLITETGAQLIEAGVQPRRGETVLVTGAMGSVGRTAVFVARQQGATVIAGVKRAQVSEAGSLDADSVAAIDDEQGLSAIVELDAIADTVDGDTLKGLMGKLKKSGRVASVLGKPAAAGNADVRAVFAHPDPDRLYRLAKDFRDGKLKIPIARRMKLSEIREAHKAAQNGAEGKIALQP